MIVKPMEQTIQVQNRTLDTEMRWYCRYHIDSDRMLNVRIAYSESPHPLYVDQEFNFYRECDFYLWKTTE